MLPTVVLEGTHVASANDAFLSLLCTTTEAIVDRAFTDWISSSDRDRIIDRHRRLIAGEPVPADYETTLVVAEGGIRAVRATVSVRESTLTIELQDIGVALARRGRLSALARVGAMIQGEGDPDVVLDRVRAELLRLDLSCVVLRRDGDVATIVSVASSAVDAAEQVLGRGISGLQGPWWAVYDRAYRDGSAYSDDALLEIEAFFGSDMGQRLRMDAHRTRTVRAGVIRLDVDGAPWRLLAILGDWLCEECMPTLHLFGGQVSSALSSARTISDLSRRNNELAAVNRLAAVARTAPDLDSLFQDGLTEIVRSIGCEGVVVSLLDRQTKALTPTYSRGRRADDSDLFVSMVCSGPTIRWADTSRDAPPLLYFPRDYACRQIDVERRGIAAVAAVPLITRSTLLGAIDFFFGGGRDVLPRDLDLLQAMASHFGAAVEAQQLLRDLRERIDELAEAQQHLVAQERLAAIGELAAVVAHEVRNPINVIFNAISAATRLLKPKGDAKTLLDIVGEEASRLNRIVGQILSYARPAAMRLHAQALVPVVQDAVAAALANDAEHIRLHEELADDLPPVPMDAGMIRQAILNIALNAVQAMPNGGVLTVRVRVETIKGRGMACVDVSDTGGGISQTLQAKIFEPFFTTKAAGTGLGLAVVKRIVESHQGMVSLSSESGSGTTFSFRLPLALQDSGSPEQKS